MADRVNFVLDPHKTTIAELLEIAEQSSTGIITIKGEYEDGAVEWGMAIVLSDNAGEIIDAINDGIASAEAEGESQENSPNTTISN